MEVSVPGELGSSVGFLVGVVGRVLARIVCLFFCSFCVGSVGGACKRQHGFDTAVPLREMKKNAVYTIAILFFWSQSLSIALLCPSSSGDTTLFRLVDRDDEY